MSSEPCETRKIGPVVLTGPARLLDRIRTATSLRHPVEQDGSQARQDGGQAPGSRAA